MRDKSAGYIFWGHSIVTDPWGRISSVTALAADVLNIKPIMHFSTGTLATYQKCRGMKKARKVMIEAMKHELETNFREEYEAGNVYLMAASSSTDEITESDFWLIAHIGYVIHCDECERVFFVDEAHQSLVFGLIYDCDNLITFLHIVSSIRFINSCSAMQFMNNEVSELLFFFRNDTYTSLHIVVKDKMIQYDAVEISSEDTQDNSLFVVDQCRRKRDAHA